MNIRTANLADILKLNTSDAKGIHTKQNTTAIGGGYLSGACYTEGIRSKQEFNHYTKQGWEETLDAVAQAGSAAGNGEAALSEQVNTLPGVQQGIQSYIQSVSPDSYEKFSEMGIIPDQENPENFLTVSERIEIQLAANCENYVPTGNIDIDDIQAMYGTSGRAFEISNELKARGINVTRETVHELEQSLKMAEELKEITPQMTQYLIKNQMPLTLENVYKAQYSVANAGAVYQPAKISDTDWKELESSMIMQLENLGIEATPQVLADGRWLVEQQLPVTTENIQNMQVIRQLNNMGAGTGLSGVSANQWIYGLAEEAVRIFEQASHGDLERIVYQNREVTLLNMKKVQEETVFKGQEQQAKLQSELPPGRQSEVRAEGYEKKVRVAAFYLEEIQLTMSVSGFALLIKNGMDLQIASLKEIAEGLAKQKNEFTEVLFHSAERELSLSESIYTKENVTVYENSVTQLYNLMSVPVQALGSVAKGEIPFEVDAMETQGRMIQSRMQAAGMAYETMGTRPREDLGDSIRKAFDGIDKILTELELPRSEENRRAVRILAYNEMELTKENVFAVKSLDLEVTRLLENMTPKTAIYLIANGMNPLKTDIRKLNDELEKINDRIEADSGENFGEFLWKLDKANEISPQDRKAYLSIYKIMRRIQKQDRSALGELLKQNKGELSLQSLLEAAENLGRHVEVEIDDSVELRYANNLIRESLEHMEPQAMAELDLQTVGLEEFVERMVAYQEEHKEQNQATMQAYYKERILEEANARNLSESTFLELLGNRITPSISNLLSASAIMSDFGKGFLRMLGVRDGENGLDAESNTDTNVENNTDEIIESAIATDANINTEVTEEQGETQGVMRREQLAEFGAHLIESMESESEFVEAYSTLKEDLQRELERQQMLCAEGVMESFSELWMQNRVVSYVNQAEQTGSYYIPVALGMEMTTIHLTIQKDAARRGTVEIAFETEKFGEVEATLQVTVTEVRMCAKVQTGQVEAILRGLEQAYGWSVVQGEELRALSAKEVPETDVLYQAAKLFMGEVKRQEELL